jgi:hypothetical protein
MPDEAALIEAPTDAVAEIDNAVSTEVDASSTQVDDSGESQETSSEAPLKGSALWREVKTLTQEGKPLTPKQLSALNKVIHRSEAVDSKYPEGLGQLEKTMADVRRLSSDENEPIEQVIENTVKDLTLFRRLDNLFSGGKAEFVDELVETSPEAFENIAPAVFRKLAEINNPAYSKYIAEAAVGHMNQAEVPLQFSILQAFLPQLPDGPVKERVLNAVEAIYAWTEGLKGLATRKIEAKAVPNAQNGANPEDLATENANLKMENARVQWNASVRTEGVNFVRSEASKVAGKVPLTEKEHQTVLAKVGEEMEARLTADRNYGQAMQGYLKANNRAGYLQRIQSERKKMIPGAVRRAVADVVEASPKNAPKAAVTPNGQPKAAVTRPLAGATQFRRIAGPPRTLNLQVDHSKTTHSMLERRQAYIKGEVNPVTWGAVK